MRSMAIAAAASAGFALAVGNPAFPQERGDSAKPRMESQAQEPDLHCSGQDNDQVGLNPPGAQGAGRRVDPQSVRVSGNGRIDREQAAKIAEALIATATPQTLNAQISVGAPLPGEVDLRPLPPAVVELAPEYRGFESVVVHDQVAIIDPSTRRVVELIKAGAANPNSSAAANAVRGCS